MAAERHDIALGQQGGQGRRQYDLPVERGAQLFQARGMVDGRSDHREVEARAGADIAEHDLADMQRQPEAQRRLRRP